MPYQTNWTVDRTITQPYPCELFLLEQADTLPRRKRRRVCGHRRLICSRGYYKATVVLTSGCCNAGPVQPTQGGYSRRRAGTADAGRVQPTQGRYSRRRSGTADAGLVQPRQGWYSRRRASAADARRSLTGGAQLPVDGRADYLLRTVNDEPTIAASSSIHCQSVVVIYCCHRGVSWVGHVLKLTVSGHCHTRRDCSPADSSSWMTSITRRVTGNRQ